MFLYAIGSGALQGIDNNDGAGFGYGVGADYRITDNIALNECRKNGSTLPVKSYCFHFFNAN